MATAFSTLYGYAQRRHHNKPDDAAVAIQKEAVNRAMRRIAERNEPHFLKQGYVNMNAPYDTGVVIVAEDATTMTGVGTSWSSTMIGEYAIIDESKVHFLIGSYTSTTILGFGSSAKWEYDAVSSASYKIYRDAFDLPSDFRAAYKPEEQSILRQLTWVRDKGEWFHIKAQNHSLTGAPKWACFAGGQLMVWPYPLTARVLPFWYWYWPAALTSASQSMDYEDNKIDFVYRAIDLEMAIERGEPEGVEKAMQLFLWQERRTRSGAANPAQDTFELGAAVPAERPFLYTIGEDE